MIHGLSFEWSGTATSFTPMWSMRVINQMVAAEVRWEGPFSLAWTQILERYVTECQSMATHSSGATVADISLVRWWWSWPSINGRPKRKMRVMTMGTTGYQNLDLWSAARNKDVTSLAPFINERFGRGSSRLCWAGASGSLGLLISEADQSSISCWSMAEVSQRQVSAVALQPTNKQMQLQLGGRCPSKSRCWPPIDGPPEKKHKNTATTKC